MLQDFSSKLERDNRVLAQKLNKLQNQIENFDLINALNNKGEIKNPKKPVTPVISQEEEEDLKFSFRRDLNSGHEKEIYKEEHKKKINSNFYMKNVSKLRENKMLLTKMEDFQRKLNPEIKTKKPDTVPIENEFLFVSFSDKTTK